MVSISNPTQPLIKKQQIVRMKDIAAKGNVSLATVSRVLNGVGLESFSAETQERVLRAAKDLGWSPNRLVRGIQTGRTDMAGVMMASFGNHWQVLMAAMHQEMMSRGTAPLVLYPLHSEGSNLERKFELEHLQSFMERRVDGIVTWPIQDPEAVQYLIRVCAAQVPVVVIDYKLPDPAAGISIMTNDEIGIGAALDHLLSLGHRKIGYVGRVGEPDWIASRHDAFINQMAKRKLKPAFMEEVQKHDPSALGRLESKLISATAVIAASDQLSLGVWNTAHEAGLHVPRDLSIVGYGRMRVEFALWPEFTSIDQRPAVIGQTAARLLLNPAERAKLKSTVLRIDPVLVPGQTSGPCTR